MTDFMTEAQRMLHENGLDPGDALDTSGTLVRCGTIDKPRSKNGAYILHADAPASLWWQNWATGESGTHSAQSEQTVTPEERKALREHIEADRAARDAEQQARHAQAAKNAAAMWKASPKATDDHPYLTKKGVPSLGLKMTKGGQLVIPVMDAQGKPQSIQFIGEDGGKLFMPGGKASGGFFFIPAKDGGKSGPLLIAEGYATAASLHTSTGHAVLVAFNAGNLMPVARMARAQCPQREIIVCADNDVRGPEDVDAKGNPLPNAGVVKATEAASAIGAKLAVPPAHEGRTTDFNDLYNLRSPEAVRACVEAAMAPQTEEAKSAPMPLRRPSQEQPPYPIESLGVFAEGAASMAQAICVPVPMAAASILAALSLCAQGVANVHIDGRVIPLSLFCLSVADSGDRKSSVDTAALEAVKEHEKDLLSVYAEEYKAYERELTIYELSRRRAERSKDSSTLKDDLERLGDPPVKPAEPILTAANVNAEGIFRQLRDGRQSLGIISDEGGNLLGGTAFAQENVLKSITFLSSLWDGKPVDKIRAGEGASRVYGRRCSVHLMVQPVVAEAVLSDPVLLGQGFLPRFLVSWPVTLKGTRIYQPVDVRHAVGVQTFYAACRGLLHVGLRESDDGKRELLFDALTLDAEAKAHWVSFHNHVESQVGKDGNLELVAAFASKTAEQALRVAGVLSLATDPASRLINLATMNAGIQIAQWHLAEILRLREDGITDPDILRAEGLLKWLHDKQQRFVSVRHIVRRGPNSMRESKVAKQTINMLVAHGWLEPVPGGAVVDGSLSREAWEVQPCR